MDGCRKCFSRGREPCTRRGVNRLTALLIAIALWAGIYLPGLGSPELKGEEGRRIMPAVEMARGGDWVVPHVGGEPFLRKPPLVQWCMAGSFKVIGMNPWAARLPSALSVLALAAVIILATKGWLIAEQSLLAAVVMMTQVAMIDKCRLAELEAIYISLSGIAMVLWMSWWARGRSPWLLWVVPFVFNGLALLAKAPMHLVFFYAVVIAALWQAREMRRLWSLAHLAGISVMLGIFAAWAVPYYARVDHAQLAETLNNQAVQRFTGAEVDMGRWALNIPSGLGDHLPWVLFVPLLWMRAAADGLHERSAALLRGGRWAVAGCFVVLLLIPGVLPRYVLPVTAPFSILLAQVLWDCPRRVQHWWRYTAFGLTFVVFLAAVVSPFLLANADKHGAADISPALAVALILPVFCGALLLMALRRRLHEPLHLTLWTGLVVVMAMCLFAIVAVPWMRLHEELRPFAQRIDEVVPEGKKVVAYSVGDFAPLLATIFYMQTETVYASSDKAAPDGEQYYLLRGKQREKFEKKFRVVGAPVAEMEGKEGEKPAVVVRAERRK